MMPTRNEAAAHRKRRVSAAQIRWLGVFLLAALLPQAPFVPIWVAGFGTMLVVLRMLLLYRDRIRVEREAGAHSVLGARVFRRRRGLRDPAIVWLFSWPRTVCRLPVRAGRHQISRGANRARRHAARMPRKLPDRHAVLLQPVAARSACCAARAGHPRRDAAGAGAAVAARPPAVRMARSVIAHGEALRAGHSARRRCCLSFFRASRDRCGGCRRDAGSKSGLSEQMAPGSISELSLSDAVAFRVDFDGAVPPPAQRYWRGPVMSRFDGREWIATRSPPAAAARGPSAANRLLGHPGAAIGNRGCSRSTSLSGPPLRRRPSAGHPTPSSAS